MVTRRDKPGLTLISWATLAHAGITAVFFLLFYSIWSSVTNLDRQLQASAGQFAAAHGLRVEYKNEVQEWKDVLLRSKDNASLAQNWQVFEVQYRNVADAAKNVMQHNDVRAINVKLADFIEAHKNNFLQYRKSTEILARHKFDFRPADAAVKGIDRPLLDTLDAVDAAVEQEKTNSVERLVAKAQNRTEQTLIALAFMVLILVWRPKS
jgi:methyl-accepting chemotaxis protein